VKKKLKVASLLGGALLLLTACGTSEVTSQSSGVWEKFVYFFAEVIRFLSIGGNIGVGIILFTLLIRTILLPVFQYQMTSSRKMQEITYDEMLEMARLGAGVMQPRSVEMGKHFGIPIHVRSTFTEKNGTMIREAYTMEEKDFEIRGLAHDDKVAKLAIMGVPNQPGVAHSLFSALAEANVSVDMIVQSVRNIERNVTDMVFTVAVDDLETAHEIVENVKQKLNAVSVLVEENVAKVSIVGVGMLGNPGIAARMFGALHKANINIDIISTSEISISCLIAKDKLKEAANAIHDEFFPRD